MFAILFIVRGLREIPANKKNICLVLANYPVRNGRLANGVGLDTPTSLSLMLSWLKEEGYNLGNCEIPKDGNSLMSQLLESRTNDPQSNIYPPLEYISIDTYLEYWIQLSKEVKEIIKI